jgi:DEAD/DEAH box helicase/Helicase conserved C-terminal domain
MYGRGIEELLNALPSLDGLDDDNVRRLLSRAWLDVAETRELGAQLENFADSIGQLRRLATALQIHAVIVPGLTTDTVRACSFVAAEALDIARELVALGQTGDVPTAHERILVGLLYLIAGYDANAAVAVRTVQVEAHLPAAERFALGSILILLRGGRSLGRPADADESYLHEQVRSVLLLRIGDLVKAFTLWLRDPARTAADEAGQLLQLADALRITEDDISVSAHADVQHLARVTSLALTESAKRAVREVAAPPAGGTTFTRFLKARCAKQPLLWPAVAEFAREALAGPSTSAIVAVPTGAGKSGVADLAIQHAIMTGWVIYLAPTNALVGQIRRQLRRDHPGVEVRQFLGGAEYTSLADEALEDIAVGQVLVMTPEKCSLALRQSPASFSDLSLVILDEAHVLGERKGRGVLTELVLAEILTHAESAVFLLMSALIANPDDLADWFAHLGDRRVAVIREPWRPTRTLRAVVGVDRGETVQAAQEPGTILASLPPRRRNVTFEARLAVLAGLRGPWSTQDERDYAVVKIGASTPMSVTRPPGGGTIRIDPKSAGVRQTVEALAQLLGERGQKVMAFLTRSRHDCFMAALSLQGFHDVELEGTVQALLQLATAELGVESLLARALAKGAGVHTSALLAEERRASEIAFDEGDVAVLFATGTLAQGLNLPATTVIVGGTEIGYDPDEPIAEKLTQQRSQLLNAIGRAGRARVASRSLALVVPNDLPLLDVDTVVTNVLPRAEFLAEEDASTELTSALRPLLGRLRTETVETDHLSTSDHVAVSYLSTADIAAGAALLRNTWAARQARLDDAEPVIAAIRELTDRSLEANGGPAWAQEAARRAGVGLPIAAQFARYLIDDLADHDLPESTDAWLKELVKAITNVVPANLWLLLQRKAFKSTKLDDLWSDDPILRGQAANAMLRTLQLWVGGETLAIVGGAAHGSDPIDNPGRGVRDPLPRTIRLVESGIAFGLTRAAGLLAATLDVAVEQAIIEAPSRRSRVELERLPIALRFGAADRNVLALIRAGARPRVVAHTLLRLLPSPSENADDAQLQGWATQQLSTLPDQIDDIAGEESEVELVRQYLAARDRV